MVDIRNIAQQVANEMESKPEDEQPKSPAPEEEAQEQEMAESEKEEAEPEEIGEVGEEAEEPSPKQKGKYVPISRFNEVWRKLKTAERTLEALIAQQQQLTQPTPKEEKIEMPDLDAMTPKEQAQWLLKTVGEMMHKTVSQYIEPIRYESKLERAQREVQECIAKYPDYLDYRDKMIELAEKHPTLSAEEVYFLAKGDKGAVAKSVVKRVQEKTALKKKAKVETRSSSAAKVEESAPQFKNAKEAAMAVAKKLGLVKEE